MGNDLAGLRVVITRPARQAAALVERIKQAGGRPLLFPLLAIADPADPGALRPLLEQLPETDLLIFVSPNAVHYGLRQVAAYGGLPPGGRLACVGEGTARALEQLAGRSPDLLPAGGYDSEALLALPALQQVDGQRVVIFRGQGGREQLAETLRARGAQVGYAEVYRRVKPDNDPERLLAPLRQGEIDIITVTSSEALENLIEFGAPELETLQRTPLVVFHQRIADAARRRGFHGPLRVCDQPGDDGLLETLRRWRHGEYQRDER
ncbi:MAG: uroporphyrinogen-III synthase [Thiohalophilus sp.]